MELVVMQAIEIVLGLAAMVFALTGRHDIHPVPKMMGIISGILTTLFMSATGAPSGASLAGGLVVARLLGEIGDFFLDRY